MLSLPKLSGLKLWCRADLGVQLAGSKLKTWKDQSGNGNDLVQATDAARPTFLVSSANMGNGSSLQLSGAQKLTCAGLAPSQPNTIVVLAKFGSLSGNPGLIDDGSTRQLGYVASAGPSWTMDDGATLTGGTADTATHMFAFVFNGASSKLYIDWADVANASGNAGSSGGTGGFVIGTQSTGFMTGEIAEVLAYNRALSASEINQLAAYFADGLVNNTRPTWHPPSTLAVDGNSIFFGDLASPASLGFANRLAGYFPGANFVNSAVEGFTTPQVITQSALFTDPEYSALRPNNVVIMGEVVNDYHSGSNVATCIANLTSYVTARHAAGWKVVLCTPTPSSFFVDADRLSIRTSILGGATGADVVCDLGNPATVMGNASALANTSLYVDDTHPTSYGHSLLLPPALAAVKAVWQ